MAISLNKASLKVKDAAGSYKPVMVLKDDSRIIDQIEKRMKRYIVRLVKTGDNYVVQDYYTQAALSFDELKTAISDTSNYVVCVYGNSKLRPQYVSTAEMMFIGLDRASADAKVLRLLVTPTRTAYEVFSLASASDVSAKYTKPSTGIPEADLAEAVQEKLGKADTALQSVPEDVAKKSDIPTIPTALPNPNALTFTGAATGSYDGSEPLTIDIPNGGGGGGLFANWQMLAGGTIEIGDAANAVTHTGVKYGDLNNYKMIVIVVFNATSDIGGGIFALIQGADTTAWKRITFSNGRGCILFDKLDNHRYRSSVRNAQNVGSPQMVTYNAFNHQSGMTIQADRIFDFTSIQNIEICITHTSATIQQVSFGVYGI